MHYVYTISINKVIFYVGYTTWPLNRYQLHYYDCCSCIYPIVRYALSLGRPCEMTLLHCYENKMEALNMEQYYIELYSKEYFLINIHNRYGWDIFPNIKNLINGKLLRQYKKSIKEQTKKIDSLILS